MNDSLRDIVAIAAETGSRRFGREAVGKIGPLHAVDEQTVTGEGQSVTPLALPPASEIPALGRAGLRMAFWLCGFHEVLLERQRAGERLSEREQSLLTLSLADFANIRPAIISAALWRFHDTVHDPALLTAANGVAVDPADNPQAVPTHAELFALETVGNLASRARQTFETNGPDAALSLFGGDSLLQEPLAIFQSVFSSAVGLIEFFQRQAPVGQGLLVRLAEALNAEVGRI